MRYAAALAAVAASLLLSACGVDNGNCVQSHEERYDALVVIAWMPTGSGTGFPIYGTVTSIRSVCDQWEFPEGRK